MGTNSPSLALSFFLAVSWCFILGSMNASLVAMFNQWARDQGVDPAKLTHDNEPLNIVKDFLMRLEIPFGIGASI